MEPETPSPALRTVFLIQDAHSIPDAQRSLRDLTGYLREHYGVRAVALEGADGRLDPKLLRSFPDKDRLSKVFDGYLEAGELSGAAAASVLSSYRDIDYVGIEDRKLYETAIGVYLDGLKGRSKLFRRSAEI